jgi:hypothetical protein
MSRAGGSEHGLAVGRGTYRADQPFTQHSLEDVAARARPQRREHRFVALEPGQHDHADVWAGAGDPPGRLDAGKAGIFRSISTTSSCNRWACVTAPGPSLASPASSMPSASGSPPRRPARNGSWSSAISTLTGRLVYRVWPPGWRPGSHSGRRPQQQCEADRQVATAATPIHGYPPGLAVAGPTRQCRPRAAPRQRRCRPIPGPAPASRPGPLPW